jgi:hypothetical protein
MKTFSRLRCFALLIAFAAATAQAATPVGPTTTHTVKLDGVPLSSPPQSGRVLAPTFHYDAATKTLHMWVLMADAPSESLTNIRHAVSTDGLNFVSTGTMSYAGWPWTGTPWGTTGEPAMVYPKVAVWNGRYKLLLWTYNAQDGQGPWGDYNYNISVNDIGVDLNNLVVEHEGPIGPMAGGIPGQTAGAWGVVNDINYFENNFFIGRSAVAELPLGTPLTPPSTPFSGPYRLNGTAAAVMDQIHTLPPPFAPALNCFDAGSPTYYVHNDARVLANPDGTLGIIYSIRDCATGARVAPQLFYAESADNGLTWGSPAGIFSGAPVNVDGTPTTGNFALADFFVADGIRYVFFSTTNAAGDVVVAGTGLPPPTGLQIAPTGGNVQSAAINTNYAAPLSVTVKDAGNNPFIGATVTFDLPVSGASGTFPGAVTTAVVTTNASGVATSPAVTANGVVGAFAATASVGGAVTPASFSLLNTSGAAYTIVVTPTTPDWGFITESGTGAHAFVTGPATPPAGTGSVELQAVTANGGELYFTPQFAGMRLDTLKGLQFSTFISAGTNDLAFDLDVDANLAAPTGAYQGRLVFTPGLLAGAVVPGVWQTWDAYTQKGWYATRPPINATCSQATPCTLADILALYPNAGVIAQYTAGTATLPGILGFKLGNNGTTGTVSMDKLVMVREGPPATLTAWTYDFEPAAPTPATVTATAGTPQSTLIGTAFALPLSAEVRDASSQLLSGVTVTFGLPATGASGTFPGSVISATAVTTSVVGQATSPVVTANGTSGSYAATATVPGAVTPATYTLQNVGPPAVLQSAASRKVHGAAGAFNLPLALVPTDPSTEPRQGPVHTIVFTFDKPVTSATATITEGTATAAAPTFSGNDIIVALSGVADRQYMTVNLAGIVSADGSTGGSASVRVGLLMGDVNQNRVVVVSDLALVNVQLSQLTTAANYLTDINASGTITVADKGLTNTNLSQGLPPP